MKREYKINQRAFTLIEVLVTLSMLSLGLLLLTRGVVNISNMERGVASNLEMSDINNMFHMMTETQSKCANSGLVGLNLTSLVAPPAGTPPVPIPITLNISPGVPMLQAGRNFGNSRHIDSFDLLEAQAVPGSPGNYIGRVSIKASVIGKAITMRNPQQDYYLNLAVNPANNQITACSQSATPSTVPTTGSCPAGQQITGINFNNQTVNCTVIPSLKYGGFYTWLGGTNTGTTWFDGPIDATTGRPTPGGTGGCIAPNPVMGACRCDPPYVARYFWGVNFTNTDALNLAGGWGCLADTVALGGHCSMTIEQCIIP